LAHWGELPTREQKILLMDFRGMTQAQIGLRLRISQMHVSRLRTHALGYLRLRLLDLDGTRANARPALVPRSPAGRASATSANRLYGGRLHPHRARGHRGKHPRPPAWSPRDAACTACRPPASPRSPKRPGGRSPNQPPTIRGQCCGAPPTPPATCRPSSAARKPCPGDSAGSPLQGSRRTDRPGSGASSGDTLAQGCHPQSVRSQSAFCPWSRRRRPLCGRRFR
jgi:hypothetical protein